MKILFNFCEYIPLNPKHWTINKFTPCRQQDFFVILMAVPGDYASQKAPKEKHIIKYDECYKKPCAKKYVWIFTFDKMEAKTAKLFCWCKHLVKLQHKLDFKSPVDLFGVFLFLVYKKKIDLRKVNASGIDNKSYFSYREHTKWSSGWRGASLKTSSHRPSEGARRVKIKSLLCFMTSHICASMSLWDWDNVCVWITGELEGTVAPQKRPELH